MRLRLRKCIKQIWANVQFVDSTRKMPFLFMFQSHASSTCGLWPYLNIIAHSHKNTNLVHEACNGVPRVENIKLYILCIFKIF